MSSRILIDTLFFGHLWIVNNSLYFISFIKLMEQWSRTILISRKNTKNRLMKRNEKFDID